MDRKNGKDTAPQQLESDRRTLLAAASVASAAALGLLPGGGVAQTAAAAVRKTPYPPNPAEPATAADYVATMRLGTQASDFLETPLLSFGMTNAVDAGDFDRMRLEARFDHVRIPANCAARADVSGRISESYLRLLDEQIALALARFERVILDPLHHYLQWKGVHDYDAYFDDIERVKVLTAEQHAARATAIWRQLASRYRDVSRRLSFDLFNEPSQSFPANLPAGLSNAQLLAWYAAVVPAIRATGGRNATRMVWLQPWNGSLDKLRVPPGLGVVGVSPHWYNPFAFTHQTAALTPAGLAGYAEDIAYTRRWAAANDVPVWVGETGVGRYLNGNPTMPRATAQRALYTAFVRETGLRLGVPMCYWGFNRQFGLFDQASDVWLPDMLRAVTALPAPIDLPPIPAFRLPPRGRLARVANPAAVWPGFRWDAATATLSVPANTSGTDQRVFLVFPEIAVATGQIWNVRAADFTGGWRIGSYPAYDDPTGMDALGRRGLDVAAGAPSYHNPVPGGFGQYFAPAGTHATFLGASVVFEAGSPAGFLRLAYAREA